MSVSVIIPTYRRPIPLAECVESILRGTSLPDEILIIHRDGDAETESAIAKIRASSPTSVTIASASVEKPGHMPPVETGANAASSALIALVDDDVQVTPEWLQSLVNHFADPGVGVAGGRVLVPNVSVPRVKGKPGRVSWYGKSWGNIGAYQGPSGTEVDAVMEGNSIWRRELLAALEFDPGLNFDDAVMYGLDLCLQAKKRGFRIVFEPRALVYHHVAPRPAESDRKKIADRLFTYCRNYTYVLLKELPTWRRPIFLAWWYLVGERGAWGAASLAYDVLTRGFGKERNIARAWQGKAEGIRQWRMRKNSADANAQAG
jgi:GT2 family glycosyltransferase